MGHKVRDGKGNAPGTDTAGAGVCLEVVLFDPVSSADGTDGGGALDEVTPGVKIEPPPPELTTPGEAR